MTSWPVVASPPTFRTAPQAANQLAGEQAVRFAEAYGLVLDDWQTDVLLAGLGATGGHWSTFEVGICCPRQNGKSAILEALMLSALFLDGGLTIYSAHEFKTAREIWLRFDQRILANRDLDRLVKRRVTSTNEMGLELKDGSRLRFLARRGTQGRGFTADRMVFDEAMVLSSASMGALIPTLSARRNTQVWYAGSAGFAGEESDHWRSLRDRGRAGGSGRLAWFEWCALEPPEDLRDPFARAAANPGYPERLTDESLDDELETLGTREETIAELVRERFGVWDAPVGIDPDRIPPEAWAAATDPASAPAGRVAFAVDMSPNGAICSIGVAGLRADGLVHLGVVDSRPGTDWVAGRLRELIDRHKTGLGVVWQPTAPVGALASQLKVPLVPMTGTEFAQACGAFKDAVMAGRIRHGGTPALDAAFASAERRVGVEGAWTWGRRRSAGDISPLVAVTEALWGLSKAGSGQPNVFFI